MSNIPAAIRDRVGPIIEPLHDRFELSRERFNSIPNLCRDEDQGWARTSFLRCFLWQNLCDEPLPESWVCTGKHWRNGEINLAHGPGDMKMRFVHAFPHGEIPAAGMNRARRAYYSNQALAEISDPNFMPTHNFLLTWEESPDREGPFILTLVRPISTGSMRSRVKADLYLPLPRELTAFERLRFDPADDDEMLELDIDENDGDVGSADDGR
jgi:hypothetical protein